MDWNAGSRVSFLQTQLFPVCQTLAAKGTILKRTINEREVRYSIALVECENSCFHLHIRETDSVNNMKNQF